MDEQEFLNDESVKIFMSAYKEVHTGTFITNPEKVKVINAIYEILKKIISGDNLVIECNLHAPSIDDAVIYIEGSKIKIINTDIFAKINTIADSFEVFPKTNGNICLDFGFDNIATRIGG